MANNQKMKFKDFILSDNTKIRKTTINDIPQLREIFAFARQFMVKTGNPNQWVDGYPSDDQLMEDIESGDSYVVENNDKVVATFVLRGGIDPTYNKIYGGEWLNEEPYATIHRIASTGEIKGIMNIAITFALKQYENIRIDTHSDNKVMQQIAKKEGFRYCGIINCWNGTERLAYQYTKTATQESET